MSRNTPSRASCGAAWLVAIVALCAVLPACQPDTRHVRMQRRIDILQTENSRLRRGLDGRDAAIDRLRSQIQNLQDFDDPRGATLFAPVDIRISGLSGGKDYDGVPGDDGVSVYVQPVDADGNVVAVGGRLTVQLVDNTNMDTPRVVGLRRLEDPHELRQAWHGRFLTNHYTVKCPWLDDVKPPVTRRIDVNVAFVDFLTGATLRAHKEVEIEPPGRGRDAESAPTAVPGC